MTVAGTTEQMEAFWNDYYQAPSSFLAKEPDEFNRRRVEYSATLCEGFQGADVLEVGAGDGVDAIGLCLKYQPKSIEVIELAEARVERAKENVERAGLTGTINVRQMDAHELDYPDDSFDAILCNSVLLFLDRPRAFEAFVRVLRPGGFLVCLDESLAGNPLLRLYRSGLPKVMPNSWKKDTEKLTNRLTVEEIEALGSTFFERVEHREFYLLFSILTKVPYFAYHRLLRQSTGYDVPAGKYAEWIDDRLMDTIPALKNWGWVSVIRFQNPRKK